MPSTPPRDPRRAARAALLLALAAGCGGGPGEPRGAGRPDVVLMTLDTTRVDYLSCYGHPGETTPNLDRLAAEGTRFDLAISTAAVTPVSHASILTGRFNRDHGVRVLMAGGGFRLADSVPTLGTVFQAAGYRTIAVHSAFPVSPHYGLAHGFDVVESFTPHLDAPAGAPRGIEVASRRSDESIDIVLRELDRVRDPFFLWLHLWDPHDENQLPPADFMPDRKAVLEETGGSVTPAARAQWGLAIYAAEVHYMDAQIGRLLQHLRDTGRYENTIFAVTADHGQGLEDHDWPKHRVLYQEQIHVPLIVRVPGLDPVGAVSDLVRTVDIAPTLLDFAGLPPPDGMAGISLRDLMAGASDARTAFADQVNGYDLSADMVVKRPQDDFSYCAMDRDWKLIWRPNHPELSELYHLAEDPGELEDLWAWDHPEALRLRRLLGAHAPWVSAPFALDEAGSSEQFEHALRSLGYTGDDGEASGPEWEWVCPEDYGRRADRLGRCPDCGEPMILIAAGK